MGEELLVSREGIGIVAAAAEPLDVMKVGREEPGCMRIYLHYQMFRNLDDFALHNTSSERAALLLGSRPKDQSWIRIEEKIDLEAVNGEYPESVWRTASEKASKLFPGKSVVGWFHSHPNASLALTEKEAEIQNKYFVKAYQVIYISDPVVGKRGFYFRKNGKLQMSGGFNIYGKPEKVSVLNEREPSRPEEYMNERYLERSVEKLQRMIKNPAIRPIDYVILVIAALCLVMQLLRPAPTVKVDQRDIIANQSAMAERIEEVDKHVKSLEGALEASGIIDRDLKVEPAGSDEKADDDSKAGQSKSAESSGRIAASGDKIIIHTVKSGETISSIAQKYYATSDAKVCRELGKFNKLPGPGYDYIVPGDKLKVPSRRKVGL
ncbi:LysM peptidoglycan-binding domain-containing protein [bacterium]|nr:LysM peptidoglycan-binding domain-containing protein [bacterium]